MSAEGHPHPDSLNHIRRHIGIIARDQHADVLPTDEVEVGRTPSERVRLALCWPRQTSFDPLPEDLVPLELQSEETATRTLPSIHTCIVNNLLLLFSLLLQGILSRFVGKKVPPVYLSLDLNFLRDEESGEIFTVEPTHDQKESEAEARAHPKTVGFALDPEFQSNWISFFCQHFLLVPKWEVWLGDKFKRNEDTQPTRVKARYSVNQVWTLHRCMLSNFENAVRATKARAGVVLVFRRESPKVQPFGIWLGWLLLTNATNATELVVVDVQNARVSSGLREAIDALEMGPTRAEIFFAPLRATMPQ